MLSGEYIDKSNEMYYVFWFFLVNVNPPCVLSLVMSGQHYGSCLFEGVWLCGVLDIRQS